MFYSTCLHIIRIWTSLQIKYDWLISWTFKFQIVNRVCLKNICLQYFRFEYRYLYRIFKHWNSPSYSNLYPFLEFINYITSSRHRETSMRCTRNKKPWQRRRSSRFSHKRVHRLRTCRLGWHNWFLHCRSWQQWSAQHNNTWPCHFPCAAARTGREVRCVWVRRVRFSQQTPN